MLSGLIDVVMMRGLYRRHQQDEMIERDVMLWLVQLLTNCDMLSDYMLEYAVALLMNLCLRTAGQLNLSLHTYQSISLSIFKVA